MRRFAAFVFAFLAVCYMQAADAQFNSVSNTKPGDAGFSRSGGGPTGTPVSNACINSSGTAITFTAQGVGGANPKRISVVSINWADSTVANTAELNTVTIGGLTMARAVRAAGDNQSSNAEIWYAVNPTGTTANIVATFSTAVDAVTIEVYSLIGYTAIEATTTGTTSISQAYTNKQLALATASRRTNVSTSLSNMVNDYSTACGSGLWGVHASQPLKGNGTLSSSISPTSSTPLIAAVVWSASTTAACTESITFLARTTGLNNAHRTNYDNLICGMVTDATWPLFDMLHIYATADSTTALLNLKSTSFNGTAVGSPTFTVDRGFTGVDAATATKYIDTNYNTLTTFTGQQYTQNNAHLSVWSNTAAASTANGGASIGQIGGGTTSQIFPRYSDGNAYWRINGTNATGVTNASGTGHYLVTRGGTTTLTGYKNAVVVKGPVSDGVGTPPSTNILVLAVNSSGVGPTSGYGGQLCMASAGNVLDATQTTNFYNRLRTYMTAVGVP